VARSWSARGLDEVERWARREKAEIRIAGALSMRAMRREGEEMAPSTLRKGVEWGARTRREAEVGESVETVLVGGVGWGVFLGQPTRKGAEMEINVHNTMLVMNLDIGCHPVYRAVLRGTARGLSRHSPEKRWDDASLDIGFTTPPLYCDALGAI